MKQKEFDYEEQNSKIYGVVTAVVTNTQDPNKQGRIKVKYVWMSEAKTIESDWARVVSFMAGNARGAHFLPEVDDEVLVSFEHGNINAPFVVGALYNAKDKVIEENEDGKNNIKMIKSRSGHTITLDDTDGEEKFILSDSSGKRALTFDIKEKSLSITNTEDAGPITIEAKGELTLKSEDKVNIEGTGDISIKSDAKLSLEGSEVSIKSTKAMTLKGGTSFEASAGSTMKVSGSSSAEVSSSGSASLEGSTVSVKGSASATLESSGSTSVSGTMVQVN